MTNKVKMVTVLSGQTLESTAAATQAAEDRVLVETYESSKLNLCCAYTTGADETSNTAALYVEGFDGTNWIQMGVTTVSTGTGTYAATTYNIAGASAATTYYAHFTTDINFQKIRVAASESGVATNKGTLTVVALVQ